MDLEVTLEWWHMLREHGKNSEGECEETVHGEIQSWVSRVPTLPLGVEIA